MARTDLIPRSTAALCLALVAAACNNSETPAASTTIAPSVSSPSPCGQIPSAGSGGMTVKEGDFFIEPETASAPSGEVSFDIVNEGPHSHQFVVFKSDLDPAKLPLNDDGTVDEEGAGVQHIAEVEDIAACTSESLSATLASGNYVFVCNLPGHYGSGMHSGFAVS
jgi:uncharacterized cupredoxin-like copper-binding protein